MQKKRNQLTKAQKIMQIYDVFACIGIIALFGSNMLMSWNLEEGEMLPYFNRHFLSPIGFCLFASIAFTLPHINKTVTGDPNGERVMNIAGILFVALAIITLIISFLG